MSKFVRNNLLKNTIVSLKETHMNFNDQGVAEIPEEYIDEVLELTNYFQVNEDGSEYTGEVDENESERTDEIDKTEGEKEEEVINEEVTDNASDTEDDADVNVPENETTDQLKVTLEGMTIKQLARYAVKEKINLGAATKKDEIISVILDNKVVVQ